MRQSLLCILFCGLSLALVAGAVAWERESPRELIRAYRIWKLTEALDLSEEQMAVFFTNLRKIDESEARLREEEHKAVREIANLLEKEDVDEAELERALARHEEMMMRHFENVRNLRREATSVLSVKQRCQYVVFEERFRSELRNMIGRVRELGGRRGMEEGGEFRGPRDPGSESGRGGSGRQGKDSGAKAH